LQKINVKRRAEEAVTGRIASLMSRDVVADSSREKGVKGISTKSLSIS
jgi:hypothetical protein